MNLLNRINFSMKLRLMSLAGLVGLGAFAAVAFSTLHAVQINSALYQDIALAYQLAGDCYDPPASLLDALAPAISAEDATTPEETRKFVALVQQAHQSFTAAHRHYQQVLPPGAIRDLMHDESGPTGEEWFAVAEGQYIPALLSGDHEAARRIRIERMNPIFARHKAANDKLAQLTGDWIPSEEKHAGSIIHTRTVELCLIFVAMALVLWFAGLAISRGIVGPVRKAVYVLSSMASGDLSQSLEVDTADEMREVADAVNRTADSFRSVLSEIAQAARQTASACAELSSAADETVRRSKDHARETQQSAAAMEEMSSAIAEVSGSAEQAAHSGIETENAAVDGHKIVGDTVQAIRKAAETTSLAAEQIETLGADSEKIGQIIGVIAEIASQTNLLALNAAIEAARAGEQGRGFAVVAGSVRRLAERTTHATGQIGAMIASIQKETAQAVQVMESGRREVEESLDKVQNCDQALERIVEMARSSGGMAQRIASAATQQTDAVRQVASSVTSISAFTDHAVTASEQTLSACNELSRLATVLQQQLQNFKVAA